MSNIYFKVTIETFSKLGMVEKWDQVLRPRDPLYLKIPWSSGTPRTSGPSDPLGPQNPWEITTAVLNSESKHPEIER